MQVDLSKVVGTATATAALVIASAIFLGNETGQAAATGGRLNELARELRETQPDPARRQYLRIQLRTLERRTRVIRLAMRATLSAMLTFVVAIFVASASTAFPRFQALQLLGAITLALGLLLLMIGILLELFESALTGAEQQAEIADLPGLDRASDRSTGWRPTVTR